VARPTSGPPSPAPTDAPSTAPTGRAPSPADVDAFERRSFVLAGVAFLGVLVALIAAVVLFAGDAGDERTDRTTPSEACPPDDAACEAAREASERPGIIPEPGSGRAPEDAGDPGGALQVGLFVLIVLGLATIVALVVRSGRRARARASSGPAPDDP
jgi:hypothetical protein